jgi:hypothetical protein
MAKVLKYGNTSGIEGDFKQAPVGLYYLKCESIEQVTSKNSGDPQFEVIFTPTKDANGKKLKERYGRLWYYAPVDVNASWARRLKELVNAFGLKASGGNLAVIEGKECMARLREDTDLNGDYRPNIGKLMKVQAPEVEEDEDEDETEEEESDLDSMSRTELKKYIKDNELDVQVKKSMSDDDLRAAIQEMMEDEEEDEEEESEEEDEEEEDDEEEDEEDEESDNYESMSVAALRSELKDRELETKGKRTVLIARLRTDDVEEPV